MEASNDDICNFKNPAPIITSSIVCRCFSTNCKKEVECASTAFFYYIIAELSLQYVPSAILQRS